MNSIVRICVKIIIIFIVIYVFINSILYRISEHLDLDYKEISSIGVAVIGESNYVCKSETEIRKAVEIINKINFYPSKTEMLGQSPVSQVAIDYKNGSRKTISVVWSEAVIYTMTPNGELTEDGKLYLVNPYIVERIMKRVRP